MLGTVKSPGHGRGNVLRSISGRAPRDVVFMHGAGGNSAFWKRTMHYLSGPARAEAVDLPGHPVGDVSCRTVRDYSEAVFAHISETTLVRPVVCGHSMGSAVALTLALDHPASLGGLILIGAGAKLGVDPAIVEGLRTQPMKTIEQTITPMSYFKVDLGMGREARAALSFSNLPVFLNDYLACDGFDVRQRLTEVTARTLIICGADDRMTPPKWSRYLSENIRSSTLSFVEGAGHMVPLEKPEACGAIIQAFLSGLSP
jgi:pimeloyl-ACP methyl ester carboxylesterase